MRDIKIKVSEEGATKCYERFIANQYENNATQLVFELPNCYLNDSYFQFVMFTLNNGKTIIRQMIDSKCIIDSEITNTKGIALLQVIIKEINNVEDLSDGLVLCSQPISCFIKEASYKPGNINSSSVDNNLLLYLDEFDALLAEIRASSNVITVYKAEITALCNLLNNKIANITNGNVSDMAEVIDSRGGYDTLNLRLNHIENSINNPSIFKFVDALPTPGEEQKIYCIPSESPEENNLFDEYIFKNNRWEKIGSAKIDTSEFLKGASANSIEEAVQISTANPNELKVVFVLGEEVQNGNS